MIGFCAFGQCHRHGAQVQFLISINHFMACCRCHRMLRGYLLFLTIHITCTFQQSHARLFLSLSLRMPSNLMSYMYLLMYQWCACLNHVRPVRQSSVCGQRGPARCLHRIEYTLRQWDCPVARIIMANASCLSKHQTLTLTWLAWCVSCLLFDILFLRMCRQHTHVR